MNELIPTTNEVHELNIDLNYGEIFFETGDVFSVNIEQENEKDILLKTNENCLSIIDERKKPLFKFGKSNDKCPIIKITLPPQQHFQKILIQTGAGEFHINKLSTDRFILEMGAGEFFANELNVSDHATIENGAGEIAIKNGTIHNLNISSGAGEISMQTALTGSSHITAGVGEISIHLLGDPSDYSATVSKGIGHLSVNGFTSYDGRTYGDGPNRIDITGGVGEISLSI